MCTMFWVQYSCGCKRDTEFVQCQERSGTNVRCEMIQKKWSKNVDNYCRQHLVSA